MVELADVSRSSFYRFDAEAAPGRNRDMDLRDAVQRMALQGPSYGRPRITAELRRRYFQAVRGHLAAYRKWLLPAYQNAAVSA